MNERACQEEPTDADRSADASKQLVEHVAEDGTVIEVTTRAEMRAKSLRHRAVYVAVVSRNDRLLVHKRADWKDVFPGAWDLAFGGVCDVGETWKIAAERELLEEAGITARLRDLGAVRYEAPGVALIGRVFGCRHEGPFEFNDGEVTDTRWVDLDDLAAFVAAHEVPEDSAAIVTDGSLRGFDQRWSAHDR